MNPYHSVEEDEVDPLQDFPEIQGCETELQLYLESLKTSNLLHFWETNKAVFPRLYAITRKLFCVPARHGPSFENLARQWLLIVLAPFLVERKRNGEG